MQEAEFKFTIPGVTITGFLSEEGYALTYRGFRSDDNIPVIIKILQGSNYTQNRLARYIHEYDITSPILLNKTLKIYSFIRTTDYAAIIFEDNGGESLRNILAEKDAINLEEVLSIGIELAAAIGELHQNQIIHKDINPLNIFWNSDRKNLKITGLGVSTFIPKERVGMEAFNSENLEGTLAYIAPEQTGRISRSTDYRSDFYSMGITLYELLTRQVPFLSDSPLEIIHAHIAKTPVSPSSLSKKIPEIVSSIVMQLLEKNAEDRYASAYGIEADLRKCSDQIKNNKKITTFSLKEDDVPIRLEVPEKFYGREKEVNFLVDKLEDVLRTGEKEFTLIAGYSGVGKSSLVRELYRKISDNSGFIVTGKYDQLNRDIPYSGINYALHQWISQLLSEDEEKLVLWRKKLYSALGMNAQVILEVIPSLKNIIGPQPAVPSLGSRESQERFNRVFQDFMSAISTAEHPVIMFLDDLQWADIASLNLIEKLITSDIVKYFYLIGAYRDNEVSAAHPLFMITESIEKNTKNIETVMLEPFSLEVVAQIIADTVRKQPGEVMGLAQLCYDKTHGNPFFFKQFLINLYERDLLSFDIASHQWFWNEEEILQQKITDNVVELMVQKIEKLSGSGQKILQLAACIGGNFQLETLALIIEQTPGVMAENLREALSAGLVMPLNLNYKYVKDDSGYQTGYFFLHDRVQQAAYSLLSDIEKKELHLKIGQLLVQNYVNSEEIDDRIFEILNHINIAQEFIIDPEERRQMAALNLEAGKKAEKATANELSLYYFEKGIEFLPKDSWECDYELSFNLNHFYGRGLFALKKYELAQSKLTSLIERANNLLDKSDVYLSLSDLKMSRNVNVTDRDDTLRYILKALSLFDIKIDLVPSNFQIFKEIIRVKLLLRGKTREDLLNAENITDKNMLFILRALSRLAFICTYFKNDKLLAFCSFRLTTLTVLHGNSIYASRAYLYYGLIMLKIQKASKKTEENLCSYAKLGIDLMDVVKDYPVKVKAINYLVYGLYLHYRHHSIQECIKYFEESYKAFVATGNMLMAPVSFLAKCAVSPLVGYNLEDTLKDIETMNMLLKHTNEEDVFIGKVELYFVVSLLSKEIHPWDFESWVGQGILKIMEGERFQRGRGNFAYYRGKQLYNYIMGCYADAREAGSMIEKILQNKSTLLAGTVYLISQDIYYPLSIAGCIEDVRQQKKDMKKLISFKNILQKKAEVNPQIYLNKYLLVKAEIARLQHKPEEATVCYLESIKIAKEQKYINEQAIAQELLGKYYLSIGDDVSGVAHLKKAYESYKLWGANAKLKLMEEKYEVSFVSDLSSQNGVSKEVNLDLTSILKASQTISSEIDLGRLLKKLLYIILENSGAQSGSVISKHGEEWFVEASGDLETQHAYLVTLKGLDQQTNLPLSLIRYVKNKEEYATLSLDSDNKRMLADPYILENNPKSMMAFPILYHGKMSKVIYLENKDIENCFTKERIETLNLLASQAVVSLENARLYYQATHDGLTGLANRNYMRQVFESHADGKVDSIMALFFIDLDYFKQVNDTLGHDVGDGILIHVAQILNKIVRENDVACRLGGDEFALLLTNLENADDVLGVAQRIRDTFAKEVNIKGHVLKVQSSIGISLYPTHGEDLQTVMKCADLALYEVKKNGRDGAVLFAPSE